MKRVAYEPMFLQHLKSVLGIRGIKRVVMHEPLTNLRKVIFLQFAKGTPKTEVWRGMQGAATLQAQCGKLVIAVSEDIHPENADAIFWSLAYRSDFSEDLHVTPYRSSGHGPKSGRAALEGTLMIDATLKHDPPPLALPAEAFMVRAKAIWEELGLPRLAPPGTLAWLRARGLEQGMVRLRRRRGKGRLGGYREENLRASARRCPSGNSGARRRKQ